jgi:hypothetical protein
MGMDIYGQTLTNGCETDIEWTSIRHQKEVWKMFDRVRQTLDGHRTKVKQTSDGLRMDIKRKLDEHQTMLDGSQMNIKWKSNECQLQQPWRWTWACINTWTLTLANPRLLCYCFAVVVSSTPIHGFCFLASNRLRCDSQFFRPCQDGHKGQKWSSLIRLHKRSQNMWRP